MTKDEKIEKYIKKLYALGYPQFNIAYTVRNKWQVSIKIPDESAAFSIATGNTLAATLKIAVANVSWRPTTPVEKTKSKPKKKRNRL